MAKPQKEPNKYAKNSDIQPESNLSVLIALMRMGLLLAGIVGISLDLFSKDSGLKSLLSKLFDGSNMILIPVIIVGLLYVNYLISSPSKSSKKRTGDLPMYAMMGFGVFYVFKWLL